MNALELHGVGYRYSVGTPFEKDALKKIDLAVEAGCITGLIGHTGSGKSTLVQLLNGLLRPSEGKVLLFGKNIWEKPKEIRKVRFAVGLVFQYPEYQLFEETVYADIAYGCKNMGLSKEETDARVKDAARFTGLDETYFSRSPFELSGGQKRRVAIAGILAMQPQVLVLDEPAAGLDPMGREEILGGLYSYQRQSQKTVIIVSHSMEDVARFCDRITVMNQGEVFTSGSVREVFMHANELQKIGLDIPQITKLILQLRARGYALPDLYTVEDAVRYFAGRLSSEKGGADHA